MAIDRVKRRKEVGEEIAQVLGMIDQAEIDALADAIIKAKRVFCSGWGRAGNIVKTLGMNLIQCGLVAYNVGDNTTPGITEDDLLIIFSAHGNTRTIVVIAEEAKEHGAQVALITGQKPELCPIGKIADLCVYIPDPFNVINRVDGKFVVTEVEGKEHTEIRKLLVYQIAYILNELIEEVIMEKLNLTFDDIMRNHNNLE